MTSTTKTAGRSPQRHPPGSIVPAPRRHATALLLLSLAGCAVSLYLTYVHYRLLKDVGYASLCNAGARMSCDVVARSEYSTLLGVPIALWGLWFYAVLAHLGFRGLRGNPSRFPRSPVTLIFAGGVFATLLSVALAGVAIFAIGVSCPFCIVLYAINLALLVTGWLAVRATGEGIGQAMAAELRFWSPRRGRAALFLGIPLAILGVAGLAYPHRAAPVESFCDFVAATSTDAGPREPIKLVIYSDFQCPYCKVADHALANLEPGPRLSLEHRQFPLDNDCNPLVDRPFHRGSCMQAIAAVCAQRQGKFAEFSERLFATEAKEPSPLVELAGEVGLDRARFADCLRSKDARQQVVAEIQEGIDAGVQGTPALFINGRRYEGGLDLRSMECLQNAAR